MEDQTNGHIVLLGATGTIGKAALDRLLADGYQVTCVGRSKSGRPNGAEFISCDLEDEGMVFEKAFKGRAVKAVISCIASRTGVPEDAWAVDYQINRSVLKAARKAGVKQFVLLSAICVQRPLLAFQQAKLAFEAELQKSDLVWTIVRPTAFFKSLSGQLDRLQKGKPFLIFGDGKLTACKPISDPDLAQFIVNSLSDETHHNAILPIGGPGPAITPLEQGEELFRLMGKQPKFQSVSPKLLSGIAGILGFFGYLVPPLRTKAALARIGHYYATQSMLVLNPETGEYDADLTPSFGKDTLFDHYRSLLNTNTREDLREHRVF